VTDSTPRPRIPAPVRRIFQRLSSREARYIGDILRTETVGGALLLLSAVIALAWANSPWADAYHTLGAFIPWAGLVPSRPGRAAASRALGSPFGLAWRLHRASLAGWAAGLFLLGAAYGSIGDSIEQYLADNPELGNFFPGGVERAVDSYLALTIMISALIAAAYGVTSSLRIRGEETSGRAEPVLATATSRAAWLTSHLTVSLAGTALLLAAIGLGEGVAYGLTVSDASQVPRLVVVALVYLPAAWLITAVTVLGVGWLPRAAAVVAWAAVGYCAVVALFADSFDLPGWFQRASPFAHTPHAPLQTVTATPLITVGVIAVAFILSGYAGLHRRDIGY
jgi:ABC-2 type transport system permease protein